MSLVLSPRIYGQNFKWGVLPGNKIDTVTMQPVINTALAEMVSFEQEAPQAIVQGEEVTLPISASLPYDDAAEANNWADDGTSMCFGRVSVVRASGSITFQLDTPLPAVPQAKVHLEGVTYSIDRGSQTYTALKDALLDNAASAAWIKENATRSEEWTDKSHDIMNRGEFEDPTLVDYTAESIPLYPWARKIVPAKIGANWYYAYPDRQDILTLWHNPYPTSSYDYTGAKYDDWYGVATNRATPMFPPLAEGVTPGPESGGIIDTSKVSVDSAIGLIDKSVTVAAKVVRIDDYTYRVTYNVPVRYEYFAASRYYMPTLIGRQYKDRDNYCFLDLVTKIKIELLAQKLNEDAVDLSYSLDRHDNLTSVATNEHPIDFTKNELITSGARWGGTLWTEAMSSHLLRKFKGGKQIVECEVSAKWALINNIHINTVMEVQLQDGSKIARNGSISLFEVKTIEKRFERGRFIYALRLMEV